MCPIASWARPEIPSIATSLTYGIISPPWRFLLTWMCVGGGLISQGGRWIFVHYSIGFNVRIGHISPHYPCKVAGLYIAHWYFADISLPMSCILSSSEYMMCQKNSKCVWKHRYTLTKDNERCAKSARGGDVGTHLQFDDTPMQLGNAFTYTKTHKALKWDFNKY